MIKPSGGKKFSKIRLVLGWEFALDDSVIKMGQKPFFEHDEKKIESKRCCDISDYKRENTFWSLAVCRMTCSAPI